MVKKILLLNSDLAKNRGDRAIAEGIIQLCKQRFPDAQITGLSENAKRDQAWFDIDFLQMNFQSLSPISFFKLWRQARKADLILWGGGEILKDYTNKLALWYWALKIALLKKANENIYGAYQGIGPTKSAFSKKIIVSTVDTTKKFIVRDDESKQKLIAWGANQNKIIASSDPAVLPKPTELSAETLAKLSKFDDINQDFLKNFVCIGPRDWFHYKTGGLVPFRYKKMILKIFGKKPTHSKNYHLFRQKLVEMADLTIELSGANLLLMPMHMGESDTELCRFIKARAKQPDKIKILAADEYSPADVREVMAKAKAMIGLRLHSTIIAASAMVPSINYYYVDKGRVFFEQIKQQRFSRPIENIVAADVINEFSQIFAGLLKNSSQIKLELTKNIQDMQKLIDDCFNRVMKGR